VLHLEGHGTVDRKDGATRFTEIVLRPCLVLPADLDRNKAMRILEKSAKAWRISALLSTPIRLEPEIRPIAMTRCGFPRRSFLRFGKNHGNPASASASQP
jgi:hypothetical protein